METPLNLAHRHQRKAELLLKAGKFDEAIEQHVAAEKALSEVITTSNSSTILESVKHQREYHIRQQAVIRYKKKRAEFIKEQQENLKKITYNGLGSILCSPEHEQHRTNYIVQQSIRTLWTHGSLVNYIFQASKKHSSPDKDTSMSRSLDSVVKTDIKMVNVEKLRLEQLRVSSEELRKMLLFLITDFEKLRSENKTLRSSLEELLLDHQHCILTKDASSKPAATACSCKEFDTASAKSGVSTVDCDLSG